MEQHTNIENQVDLTLNSLDGISKAEASPFFYTRLMAKMESTPGNMWTRSIAFLAQPAVSLSLLFFFLILNGYLVFSSFEENDDMGGTQDYVAQQISYFDNLNP